MKILIPERWRRDVAAILQEAQVGTIHVVRQAKNNWRNLDDAHYEAGLYAVLADALNIAGDLYGKSHVMDEDGECYSFSFRYHPPSANGDLDLYTKLNLMSDGQVVIVYSAHT